MVRQQPLLRSVQLTGNPPVACRLWVHLDSVLVTTGSGKHFNDTCTQKWRRQYWASVSYLDENVGKMLDELETLGHKDDTVVTFFGDHGWQLGEYSEWEKFTNFELAARVPLIFRVPWLVDSHLAVSALVELVDVFPTLAALASLTLSPTEPLPLDGKSLVPLMASGAEAPVGSIAMTQFPRCVYGKPPSQSIIPCDF